MATEDEGREALLEDLIWLRRPVPEISAQLRQFDWDSEELVSLSPAVASRQLRRYVSGDIEVHDLYLWAEAIESREDIGYPPLFEALLSQLIFELANPEINPPLTPQVAADWIDRLGPTAPSSGLQGQS